MLGMALRGIVFLVLLLISAASFAIPSSYATGFDLTELKAYYPFEEESGDLINEAANAGSINSLGTAADGQLESGVTQGQSGIIGNSYNFPGGSNGQIQLGTSTSQFNFMHDSTSITSSVNFWQNTISTGLSQAIIQNNVGTTSKVGIDISYRGNSVHNAGIFRGVLFTSVVGPGSSGSALPADGNWHMVTVTYDHTLPTDNLKFYHDGVFTAATTKDGAAPSTSNAGVAMELAGYGNLLTYSGNLDEMSIWSRVLSPTEITDLYNNGAGLTFIDNSQVIGGEIIPIESTSLILAGSQTFSWMIPVLLSGIGIGLFVFRKSENS